MYGTWLRELRILRHLTKGELAVRAGMGPNRIGQLERGAVARPHPRTIATLAEALQVPSEELRQALLANQPPTVLRTIPAATAATSSPPEVQTLFAQAAWILQSAQAYALATGHLPLATTYTALLLGVLQQQAAAQARPGAPVTILRVLGESWATHLPTVAREADPLLLSHVAAVETTWNQLLTSLTRWSLTAAAPSKHVATAPPIPQETHPHQVQ